MPQSFLILSIYVLRYSVTTILVALLVIQLKKLAPNVILLTGKKVNSNTVSTK